MIRRSGRRLPMLLQVPNNALRFARRVCENKHPDEASASSFPVHRKRKRRHYSDAARRDSGLSVPYRSWQILPVARPKKLVITIGCIAILLTLLLRSHVLLRENGPWYAGRPLSSWVYLLGKVTDQNAGSEHTRSAAIKAVAHIGTNAIPFLLRWIRYEPSASKLGLRIAQVIQRIPGNPRIPFLGQPVTKPAEVVRAYGATEAFELLGAAAVPAIPELASLVNGNKSGAVTDRASRALAGIGPAALPTVIQLFDQRTDLVSRLFLIFAIERLGTNALPVLHRWSADPNKTISGTVATVLQNIRRAYPNSPVAADPNEPGQ
jgi:hypothetical protein